MSDRLFAQCVETFIAKGGVIDLASEFEVAVSTVERWASGVSCPHPRMRALILYWIADHSEKR